MSWNALLFLDTRICRVRIIVIGAGIVGLSVAYELVSRGASVRVFDGRRAGHGASRATAGILAPRIEGRSEALLKLGLRSLDLYDGFIDRVRGDGDEAVEYCRSGSLQVACTATEAGHLSSMSVHLSESGVEHELLDGAAARRREPALAEAVHAALALPQHGYVNAMAFVGALERAIAARGGVVSQERFSAIEERAGQVHVSGPGEGVDADAVVIAAGAWSGGVSIGSGAHLPVRPVRGQLVHLRLPAPAASQVVWGTGCYLVSWRDGSVLVGATVEDVGFDEDATVAGVRQLLEAGTTIMPGLDGATLVDVRVGLRPATVDELSVIGSSSTVPGVFYATGHYRNGVLLAPLTATLVADLVLDGREAPELDLVRPDRLGV